MYITCGCCMRAGTPHCRRGRVARKPRNKSSGAGHAGGHSVSLAVVRTRKGEFADLFDKLQRPGLQPRWSTVWYPLTDPPKLKKAGKVILGWWWTVSPSGRRQAAARFDRAGGRRDRGAQVSDHNWVHRIASSDSPAGLPQRARWPSTMPERGRSLIPQPSSPYGACPECSGLGIPQGGRPGNLWIVPWRRVRWRRDGHTAVLHPD